MAATYVKIDPDGFVYPCCVGDRRLKMGNINRNSFAEIWNGRSYQKLRKSMFTGRYFRVCKSCKHLQRGFWAEIEKRGFGVGESGNWQG